MPTSLGPLIKNLGFDAVDPHAALEGPLSGQSPVSFMSSATAVHT